MHILTCKKQKLLRHSKYKSENVNKQKQCAYNENQTREQLKIYR